MAVRRARCLAAATAEEGVDGLVTAVLLLNGAVAAATNDEEAGANSSSHGDNTYNSTSSNTGSVGARLLGRAVGVVRLCHEHSRAANDSRRGRCGRGRRRRRRRGRGRLVCVGDTVQLKTGVINSPVTGTTAGILAETRTRRVAVLVVDEGAVGRVAVTTVALAALGGSGDILAQSLADGLATLATRVKRLGRVEDEVARRREAALDDRLHVDGGRRRLLDTHLGRRCSGGGGGGCHKARGSDAE